MIIFLSLKVGKEKAFLKFECDECKKVLVTYSMKKAKSRHQFCDNSCVNASQKHGKLKDLRNEMFGGNSPFSKKEIKEKCRAVKIAKYGTDNTYNIRKIKGPVNTPFSKLETQQKSKQTCLKRYSVANFAKTDVFKEKMRLTCLERYGKESYFETEDFKEKVDYVETHKRQHETMKQNGQYNRKTKPEAKLELLLKELYPEVEYQAWMYKWPIDFYVPSQNLYVQMDGDYWHGLDRSLDEIKECKSERDIVILKKMMTDNEQVKWFKQRKIKLFRIAESTLKTLNAIELQQMINEQFNV